MTQIPTPRLAAICLAGLPLLILPGCVRRGERIAIEPDGSAHLTIEFEGDYDDVRSGDAMLEDPGLWEVNDKVEVKDDGDDELTRTATITVPPGGEFPTHYAGNDAELADLALNMTTWLDVEERPDGTYYHFKRVYHRRDWARIDYFRRKFVEDSLKELEDKEFAELNESTQRQIARDLLDLEAIKTLVLAEAAAEALEPPLDQEDWLAIHQVIAGVFREVDPDSIINTLLMEGDNGEAEIARLVQGVRDELDLKIDGVLFDRDPSGALSRAFADRFELERRRYTISEDLSDEHWEVVVKLPGHVVGHNSLAGDPDDGEIKWEFDGDALYDRDQVLMATSVVEKS